MASGENKLNIYKIRPDYSDYLKDESRLAGNAETISFPRCEEDVREILAALYKKHIPVTVQGGRTGITGGSVPLEGHILNLSRMNKILGIGLSVNKDKYILKVQPGVLLEGINNVIGTGSTDTDNWDRESLNEWKIFVSGRKKNAYFFPPDPTETTASIGGMAANNASGSRSFLYGSVRNHICGLKVVFADGSGVYVKRGIHRAGGLDFTLKTDSGTVLSGRLPEYAMPEIKNAAGLFVKKDMDIIDLFIGSEGTLGVITEVEILLSPLPRVVWGLMIFLPDDDNAVELAGCFRDASALKLLSKPAAIEYFDRCSINFLKQQKFLNPAFARLPDIRPVDVCALYVEFHVNTEGEMEQAAVNTMEMAEKAGGDGNEIWAACNPGEIERLKCFRHAVPEAVNMVIDRRRKKFPEITKLGTDMAVPDDKLKAVMEMYNNDLENSGLEFVKFGHIGNNHIHINILPKNMNDYNKGKELYRKWAAKAVAMGGTVSAEHGIGKLKVELLKIMYGRKGLKQMHNLKKIFDPYELLNRGNISG
ncbi:MAG: FAD-binding oxidoreductase [Spirochaetes bacterium]|nr:FAD-binding oxidoreductase [Spirochaetota bacterium]